MTQWHPIFGHLLRPVLQDYFDVQTNVPVGDLPREADIIIVRRASTKQPHFETLWKHLVRWNILELKGRSESARVADIDLLVEVGLGIHRRLQEKEKTSVARADVSFWYLANHLGKRFLRDVIELIGELKPISGGVWRGRIVGRPIWLVSNRDVPINRETIPVHLVSDETPSKVREVAEVVLTAKESWKGIGAVLGAAYPNLWKEILAMAKKKNKGDIDWKAFWDKVLDTAAKDQFADLLLDDVTGLSQKKREELFRRLQADLGKKQESTS